MVAQRKRQGERNAVQDQHGQGAPATSTGTGRRSRAASYRKVHDERLDAARDRLGDAEARLREDRDDPRRPARHRGAARPGRADHRRAGASAPAPRSSSTSAAPTGSRSPAPTAPARPRCSTRSSAPSRRGRARSAPTCRPRCSPSGSTSSTPTLSVVDNVVRRAPGVELNRDPRPAGPLPVPRRGRRAAGRHPVGRRAVPRHPGRAAARRPRTPAAAARRADQQPRPHVLRRAGVGPGGVPRRAAGGQPRPAVPRRHRVDRGWSSGRTFPQPGGREPDGVPRRLAGFGLTFFVALLVTVVAVYQLAEAVTRTGDPLALLRGLQLQRRARGPLDHLAVREPLVGPARPTRDSTTPR